MYIGYGSYFTMDPFEDVAYDWASYTIIEGNGNSFGITNPQPGYYYLCVVNVQGASDSFNLEVLTFP